MEKKNIITKDLLAREVAKETNMTIRSSTIIVDAAFEKIKELLKEDNIVKIRDFGVFSTGIKKERYGSNPRTGERIYIPEMTIPKFRYSEKYRLSFRED